MSKIEITDRIDSGLYGEVYKGRQVELGRDVAIKVLKHHSQAADVQQHARLAGRVNHPAVVAIHTIEEVHIPNVGMTPALIMEWVVGEKLGKLLGEEKFTRNTASVISLDLIAGIEHLHKSQLSHGDLHLGNLLVLPDGHLKIIDIDANKGLSLGRLSSNSYEGAVNSDIEYCRSIVARIIKHTELPISEMRTVEEALEGATTLSDLRKAISTLSQMYGTSLGSQSWLSGVAISGCNSEVVQELLDAQAYFDLRQIPFPKDPEQIAETFATHGIVRRSGDGWSITNLGAILLAKKLDKFPGLGRRAPRVIAYKGTGKMETRQDTGGQKGLAVGFTNLIDHVNGLVPTNEVIGKALRQQVKMFPEIAIRELIANALVHQDFEETGMSVMIELYDDRMEISNPGKPYIAPERFIDEYQSRNERLAELMRRLRICEEKGSGIDKVISAVEAFQLPAPEFRVTGSRTSVVLYAHRDFEQMDRSDRIRACYQHCCLRFVMNSRMTNQSLRERFKVSEKRMTMISGIINSTVDAQMIKLADPTQASTRYRSYVPFWA